MEVRGRTEVWAHEGGDFLVVDGARGGGVDDGEEEAFVESVVPVDHGCGIGWVVEKCDGVE